MNLMSSGNIIIEAVSKISLFGRNDNKPFLRQPLFMPSC
jgi:hypothetical protein